MHISCCIRGIFFATVIQAWKLLLKFLGAPPDVFFPLVFSPSISHLDVVNQIVHQLLALVLVAHALDADVKPFLRNARSRFFKVIILLSPQLNRIDILGWDTELRNIRNLERLEYLLRLLIILASWTCYHLVIEVTLLAIRTFWFALLNPLSACLIRAIPFDKLWNQLFAYLLSRLMGKNWTRYIVLVFIGNHMGKVSVFHILIQP